MYNINYQFLTLNDGYIYRCGKELFTSEILRRILHNKFHHNYWVCILDSLSSGATTQIVFQTPKYIFSDYCNTVSSFSFGKTIVLVK